MAWQRLKVPLKGEGEVIVDTSARDWASIAFEELQTAGALFRVTHHALMRQGTNVPLDYDNFLEMLEGMPEAIEQGEPMDPIQTDL